VKGRGEAPFERELTDLDDPDAGGPVAEVNRYGEEAVVLSLDG